MIEQLIETLTSNPVYLAGAVVLALIIVIGIVKKLLKLALLVVALFVLFIGYLVYTGQEVPTSLEGIKKTVQEEVIDPGKEMLKDKAEEAKEKAAEKVKEEVDKAVDEVLK
ncbi:MAG: hypothetical protein ABIA75_03835 [Candidatus Neomarinimicrobiota bacterium]